MFSVSKFATVYDLVRISDNIAQALDVEEVAAAAAAAAAAVVNDVHFKAFGKV